MRLNAEQQRGVVAAGHCLISACPGSGKTRVLIKRAEHLLTQDPRNKIAAITFTKEAAGEITGRLTAALGEGFGSRIKTGTFHAIAMKQINDARARAETPLPPVKVLNDNQSRILLRRAWREKAHTHKYFEILKAVEQSKATQIPPSDPKGAVARVLARYQELLDERGALDFNDLVTQAVVGMMVGVVPLVDCTHLLVDEFQDVDQTQLSWVMEHARKGVLVTVVGDDDQSVYKFRHSLGFEGMQSFAEDTDAEEITLGTTYRCAAQIITLANRLIVHNKARIQKRIRTAEARTGIIERYDFSDESEEALQAGLMLMARPMSSNPAKQETAAILARTNSALQTAQILFKVQNPPIPCYRIGGEGIWEKGVPCMIRDLLGSFHEKGGTGIVMMMHAMHCKWDLVNRVDQATRQTPNAAHTLLETEFWKKGMDADEKAEWAGISQDLRVVRVALNSGNVAQAIDRVAQMAIQASGSRKGEAIAQAACTILGKMQGTMADRLRQLDRRERASTKDDKHDPAAIALMTLHGSKGLEFDRVWMMGVNHGVLPHADSDLDEERRLCYVGMTRAKTHLTMSTSVEEGKPSQFLEEIGLAPNYVSARTTR